MNLKEDLANVVGADKFSDSAEDLAAYSRDHSLTKGCRPACIVKPRNTGQVQKIVKLARESLTPVIPCSSRVHFYGSAVPKLGGIMVDLAGMNKILDIDELNRKVRIEPGVTWSQMKKELEPKNLRLITPLLPHADSSVLTSAIERQVPVISTYEYSEPLGGAELVWPNGDIFRTGSASAPGYPDSASKGANFEGPGINFIQLLKGAQGTMGIVTWTNVKVEYLPTVNKSFFSSFNDLAKAIRPMCRIQRLKIGQECFIINRLNLASMLAEGKEEEFARLKSVLPPWILALVISGLRRRPEEKVEYEENALMTMKRSEFPEMKISTSLSGVPGAGSKLQKLLREPWPIEETYWKHFYKGGCEDLFFITRPSKVPGFFKIVEEAAMKNGFSPGDLGCYVQPIEYARACHMEFNFYYEPDNRKVADKIKRAKMEAARLLLDEGAFFTRPYGELAKLVYEKAATYTSVLKKVKTMFDPDNIMNPGNLCF